MINFENINPINWLLSQKQNPKFSDKCLLCSNIVLSLLALLTAVGAIILLAMSGGPNALNLFASGCVLAGVCFLSAAIVIGCIIATKCRSVTRRMGDSSNSEMPDSSEPLSTSTNSTIPLQISTVPISGEIPDKESPDEVFTPGNMPNEVYRITLEHLSKKQCLSIARVNKISEYFVSTINSQRRKKIQPACRDDIYKLPFRGDAEQCINRIFNIIDLMNSLIYNEKKYMKFTYNRNTNANDLEKQLLDYIQDINERKYMQFTYDRKANANDLWTQLLDYIQDNNEFIPVFKKAMETLGGGVLISQDLFIDHFSDQMIQAHYPNKAHLKKIINPEFKYAIVMMLIGRRIPITSLIHKIHTKTSKRIEFEVSDNLLSNVRMFLDQVEEKEIIALLFQVLQESSCYPYRWDVGCDLSEPPFKGYPLILYCIDNPNFER